MGNPAEETCCHPNEIHSMDYAGFVNTFRSDFWLLGKCPGRDCAGAAEALCYLNRRTFSWPSDLRVTLVGPMATTSTSLILPPTSSDLPLMIASGLRL